jgi:hypothetical protein
MGGLRDVNLASPGRPDEFASSINNRDTSRKVPPVISQKGRKTKIWPRIAGSMPAPVPMPWFSLPVHFWV